MARGPVGGVSGSKRQLRLYLALAASYFGLYALYLTVVPSWATRYGITSAKAGALVAVIAATGFIGDVVVARITARFGARNVILAGIGIVALGSVLLVTASWLAVFVVATMLLGLALAMMMSPILSGLSSHAGEEQVRTQSTNAIWQRLGALVTALFLLNALSTSGKSLVVAAMSLFIVSLLVLALFLQRRDGDLPLPRGAMPLRVGIVRFVSTSYHLQAGLIINATTALLIIVGASFFPLVLVGLHKPDLLTAGLVGRELLAVAAAFVVRRLTTRLALSRFWTATAIVGAGGLVIFPFVQSEVILVLAFSLHGAAVGVGIVLGNVEIYAGTSKVTRVRGFATSAKVGRVASVVFPLTLGVALDISMGLATVSAGAIVMAAVLIYLFLMRNRLSSD